jgi:hypothetical protein
MSEHRYDEFAAIDADLLPVAAERGARGGVDDDFTGCSTRRRSCR